MATISSIATRSVIAGALCGCFFLVALSVPSDARSPGVDQAWRRRPPPAALAPSLAIAPGAVDTSVATSCESPFMVSAGAAKRGYFVTSFDAWPNYVHVSVPVGTPPSAGWPLVVMLSGGRDLHGSKICSIWTADTLAYDFPAIVISPSAKHGRGYSVGERSAVDILLEGALERWEIDEDRMLFVGRSRGAKHGLKLLAEGYGRFAAWYFWGMPLGTKVVDRLIRTTDPAPVYLHGGERDRGTSSTLERAARRLERAGWPVTWRIEDDMGHNPAYERYREVFMDQVFPWFSSI